MGEVGRGLAFAEPDERSAFGELALAAVFGEVDRAESLAEGGEEAAGADGWELVQVAPGMNPENLVGYFKRPLS